LETGERGGYGAGLAGREGSKESVFVSRTEVDEYLKGLSFPANKQEVLENAEVRCAPQKIIDVLDLLPNQDFSKPSDVESALERVR
jgi:hypothetical protein